MHFIGQDIPKIWTHVLAVSAKVAFRVRKDYRGRRDYQKPSVWRYPRFLAIGRMAVVLIGFAGVAGASFMVAIGNSTEIFIGADSHATIQGRQARFTACKVFQHESTIAGISGGFNPAIGFDLPKIARQIIERDDLSLSQKVAAFYDTALHKAELFVADVKATDPERYEALRTGGKPLCDVLFASIEQGRPIMYLAGIDVSESGTLSRRLLSPLDNAERVVWPVGTAKAVQQYMVKFPDSLARAPSLSILRAFLRIALENNPIDVSEPFSVVHMSAIDGISWLERGACKE
jgi:hypothetical protein